MASFFGISDPAEIQPPPEVSVIFSLWNQENKVANELFYLKVTQSTLDTGKLTDLRRVIATSPQQKDFATYTFCTDTGSVVPDSWLVSEYMAVSTSSKSAPTAPPATFTTQTESGASAGTDATSSETTKPKSPPGVCMRIPPSKSDHVTAGQPLPDLSNIDTKLPVGGSLISAPDLIKLASSYNSAMYTASAGAANSTIAASLGEREWAIISQNTEALYGFTIDRSGHTLTGASSATFPAFQYKPRVIPSYMLTDAPINDTFIALRIPRFSVDDQSYVSCYETSTAFQSSLAASSFSETDVKAAVSGGAFGVSVGVSAGYGSSASDASNTATATAADRMNISYQFPRVTMRLDENCVELTDQCRADLATVNDSETLTRFLDLYGQFFATRLQVGGRLFASDDSSTVSGSSASEKARSMKASASASFSSAFASGSVSASHGSQDQSASTESSASMISSLSWQATGGDTLLCNNPAAWCPTVGPYYNWRVTKQDGVLHIVDMIGRMPGFSSLPSQLSKMGAQKVDPPVIVPDEICLAFAAPKNSKSYLTCCDPSVLNGSLFPLFNQTAYSSATAMVTATVQLASVGIWGVQPAVVESNLSGQWIKVENLDGSPVQQACWDVRYTLKNQSVGKYLNWVSSGSAKYPAISNSAVGVVFKNPSGSKTNTPIPSGSQVQLGLCASLAANAAEVGVYGSIYPDHTDMGFALASNDLTFTLQRR